ncbi:MAG: hypothetical protein ACF8PN_08230 [Phycisphaerales bacterium]
MQVALAVLAVALVVLSLLSLQAWRSLAEARVALGLERARADRAVAEAAAVQRTFGSLARQLEAARGHDLEVIERVAMVVGRVLGTDVPVAPAEPDDLFDDDEALEARVPPGEWAMSPTLDEPVEIDPLTGEELG